MTNIKLENIFKTYGDAYAVQKFNLDINSEEFIALVGPSGCGKSTTLRMIAGLEEISSGDLLFNDKKVNKLEPKDRNIAMVFQNYALYPHLTVEENISYGLKVRKIPKKDRESKVTEAASILGLSNYLDKKPGELSGGQRQRVALGRAIVRDSDIFLMDEPLSNLDAKLRVVMRAEIIELHKRLKTTTIYVTHDQVEAMTMADRIVIMNKGEIQQIGSPREVYHKPANTFVADFIGSPPMNIVDAEYISGKLFIEDTEFEIVLNDKQREIFSNSRIEHVKIGVRPEKLNIITNNEDEYETVIDSNIRLNEFHGSDQILYCNCGVELIVKVSENVKINIDEKISLGLQADNLHFFDYENGERLESFDFGDEK
ncbi:sn-glycerol-3-phosphate ABC transporter ATP-binding protein UgpC [Jeotgalicoccus huakuii]|uniref:ABC transporter ATP-binding protein n=1 Tax=Jeotgalicoccus TaxID=227979 RepID=UPI00041171BA|nr:MULTISPECIES: sn-glycerol-3-phosphate ABC transporter ATP-binding protein UgpC [Jeotgalicoccus]MCK1976815.1 sn-glycerol-3-phosphate ABC transporter ATP-binding protein UgpC [Jeotgalicoccus huakuii]QQD84471.1 sn-glycerol-3-phosphate ABC transporter ATP-binding protein UgpC [Jeotgalicoccus sp. ATCC 8456]